LAAVLISQSKCFLWNPQGNRGSAGSCPFYEPVLCCVWGTQSPLHDGISPREQIGLYFRPSHHMSLQMKYNGENGHWVMEIDSKGTWVVINKVRCKSSHLLVIGYFPQSWATQAVCCRVIYDEGVTLRLILYGWEVLHHNENNSFLSSEKVASSMQCLTPRW
jgi:hypothetical protein